MNVLASSLLVGIRRSKSTDCLAKITFLSNKGNKENEGAVRSLFSGKNCCIVQYKNEKGKSRLAIVNRSKKIAVKEELIYVNRCKQGSAIACQCNGSKVHVILLNERGEAILDLGPRSALLNRTFIREGIGDFTTNRQWLRNLMENQNVD